MVSVPSRVLAPPKVRHAEGLQRDAAALVAGMGA